MPKALLLALGCSGCLARPGSVEVTSSGVASGLSTQELHCGTSASLDRYAAGAGSLWITVGDGTRQPAFNGSADVAGELDDSHDLAGNAGTWKLAVNADGFAGQLKITLSCL
jgi:hypothetical protein